ncbi:hypothetical protein DIENCEPHELON_51 [Klebsiella phage vB_KaeS_Diencephalon]|nr:uncharacterized protein [Enterobacter phage ATCEA85]UGO51921.1 hypothetical protein DIENCEPHELON_51 [Klebsiella phage vB_KaeS_Diencephalon]
MKRITAIAIAAAAVLGCSYVGSVGAVSCAVGFKNIEIQRDMGMYDAVTFTPEVVNVLKNGCKLGRRYQQAGATPEFFEEKRAAIMISVIDADADPVVQGQMISLVSDSLDVGFYGMVKTR